MEWTTDFTDGPDEKGAVSPIDVIDAVDASPKVLYKYLDQHGPSTIADLMVVNFEHACMAM